VRPIWMPGDKEYVLKPTPEELRKLVPAWPKDLTFENLFEKATEGRVIQSCDHPLIRRLLGK
jgi:hypothetical protein